MLPPDCIAIEPPVSAALLPAETDTLPPTPASEEPDAIKTLPVRSATASPVTKEMPPLDVIPSADPDAILIEPLEADVAPAAVRDTIAIPTPS